VSILIDVLEELDGIIAEREYFKTEYYAAQELLSKESEEVRALKLKLSSVSHFFGEALAQGEEAFKPETGPSRPNRKKLTWQEVKDIRAAFHGGMKQADLARNYGVNPSTISRTVRGFYN